MTFGAVGAILSCLRPFYALDGTHTRSRYNLTLLLAVGIDAEDRAYPMAYALVLLKMNNGVQEIRDLKIREVRIKGFSIVDVH